MAPVTIRKVRSILTAPEGTNLVVVKIETSEPGLYGLGCATFTQRCFAVATYIDEYLAPLLDGRPVANITDIWRLCHVNGYWRHGGVHNNAIGGIDEALWDIKGKMANMPVYELLGGKCREAAAIYGHALGSSSGQIVEEAMKYQERGFHYVRCQLGDYGGVNQQIDPPQGALPGQYYSPDQYVRSAVKMFEYVRSKIGFDLELLHDVHERLSPSEAVRFAKQLDDYRLFYLEDLLAPEDLEWFRNIRAHSVTPLAMGELFNNPAEWMPLITNRLIDFIRVHVTQIGGITPAKKLSALCDSFGIRTAWHGPHDVSPVGHAANVHLDVSNPNFGIREWRNPGAVNREVFPGTPE
ncbi:MAG: bifunctional D-altronate/D-mannonate dehydratase, partial [Methylobacteriaceae bacterium]|nr:bifunctional D-altronate/D-mannonate dehydratase [Methylobacteriaceae bacterium]